MRGPSAASPPLEHLEAALAAEAVVLPGGVRVCVSLPTCATTVRLGTTIVELLQDRAVVAGEVHLLGLDEPGSACQSTMRGSIASDRQAPCR